MTDSKPEDIKIESGARTGDGSALSPHNHEGAEKALASPAQTGHGISQPALGAQTLSALRRNESSKPGEPLPTNVTNIVDAFNRGLHEINPHGQPSDTAITGELKLTSPAQLGKGDMLRAGTTVSRRAPSDKGKEKRGPENDINWSTASPADIIDAIETATGGRMSVSEVFIGTSRNTGFRAKE